MAYSQILRHGQKILKNYEEIRKKYPDDLTIPMFREYIEKFYQEYEAKFGNESGFEFQLAGVYLDTMIKLNKYVYTTASANPPFKSYFFIEFNTTNQIADKIWSHFGITGGEYEISMYNFKDPQTVLSANVCDVLLGEHATKDDKGIATEIIPSHQRKESYDILVYFRDFPIDVQNFARENMRTIFMIDRIQYRTDLYKVLLEFLRTLNPSYAW
jgi:hypothetical protein